MKKIEKTEFEKRLEADMREAAAQAAEKTEPAPDDDALVDAVAVEDAAAEEAEEVELKPELDVSALIAERDDARNQLLRAMAEFDNYRKRVARDADHQKKMATEALVRDLLPVLDNLERALEHCQDRTTGLAEGVEMVLKQLHGVLAKRGVAPIEALGQAFDPNLHEAMMQTDSATVPADHVAGEFQRGYLLNGRMLRPSRVVVSKGSENMENGPEEGIGDAE